MATGAGQALGLAAVLLVACGTQPSRSGALPPPSFGELAPIIDARVAPLGVRLARGATVDTEDRSPSPKGRHLALYVEPIEPWPDDRFVATILPLTRALGPFVFERWPGLDSFDVCQDPPPIGSDPADPPPLTTVEMTHGYAREVEWTTLDLPTLVADALRDDSGLRVGVIPRLLEHPDYQEAVRVARARR